MVTSAARRTRRFLLTVATSTALVVSVAGCGLLADEKQSDTPPRGDLETSSIKVSIMKPTDLAPFHLAVDQGFFEDEGLTVDAVDVKSSDESTTKLVAGEVDIAYSSYLPFFYAEAKRAANNSGGIKFVADASSAGPGSCVVVAKTNSRVKTIEDLADANLAVSGPGSISTLLVKSAAKTAGVPYDDIHWVTTPYPQIDEALNAGHVDAAFATEPFIQEAAVKAGASAIFDTAVGPTADFPTAGWASTGDFVKENPNTIAAFQRVMQRATNLALTNRNLVDPLLAKHSGVDPNVAQVATLLTFQSQLDDSRLQRVPDLMFEFGEIAEPIDVRKMIVPTAPLP